MLLLTLVFVVDVLHLDAVHLLPKSPESYEWIECQSVRAMGFLSISLSSAEYVKGSWDCSLILPPEVLPPLGRARPG